MHFVNHHKQQRQQLQHLKVYLIDISIINFDFFFTKETDTLDPVQIEQEIEKEGLEVQSTADGEEEDTTLADIEDGPEEDVGANNIKLMMDVFVTQLPTCVNREMIDKVRRTKKNIFSKIFILGCS